MRVKRSIVVVGLAAAALVFGSSGAAGPGAPPGASAQAFAVKVVVPGRPEVATTIVSAPPNATAFRDSFSTTGVAAGAITAGASTQLGSTAAATASSDVSGLTLFGGEISADGVSGRAKATAGGDAAAGDLSGSGVTNLVVLGQKVQPAPNLRVPLADWGYLTVLAQGSDTGGAAGRERLPRLRDRPRRPPERRPRRASGRHRDPGRLRRGRRPDRAAAARDHDDHDRSLDHDRSDHDSRRRRAHPEPLDPAEEGADAEAPEEEEEAPKHRPPPVVTPQLTAGGYVFPVYGTSSYVDTFGAERGDIESGWHHGDDIFGQLGQPLLAVADGTVFSVGWNEIGGNRLWLRDGQGNQFYYAHLSAFSTLAVDGAHVNAGDVVGFIGTTGDASGTPPHLHFEVHPVSLLFRGYDGAVDPTTYLSAWRKLEDVDFPSAAGWAPPVPGSALAPEPGAILLQVSDISRAAGLDPASLRRAYGGPAPAAARAPAG